METPPLQQQQKSPMVLIPPPTNPNDEDARALALLRKLGRTLGSRSTRKMLDECIRRFDDHSVRRIQTGRYEIFVSNAADKGSACLDKVLRRNHYSVDETRKILLEYAKRQALKDTRISPDDTFGNYSIILTYGKSKAQAPHLDLLFPNHQFGLLLSHDSPGTIVYLSERDVKTIQDLEKLWNDWNANNSEEGSSLAKMPTTLVTAMQQSKDATNLIRDYGQVLVPEQQFTETTVKGPLPSGSLFSLPGSKVHAGPEAEETRAVLFFSSCPNRQEIEPYHPDTQYSGTFLVGHLTTLLWRMPGMSVVERQYMLQMFYTYTRESSVKRKWASHFPFGDFSAFVEQLESDSISKKDSQRLITETAKNEALCFFNIESDFEIVSVDGLCTKWNDDEFDIGVYRRPFDDKILVKYKTTTTTSDDDNNESTVSWEGGNTGDEYSLKINDAKAKFNGENGTLLDTDGNSIHCYCRKPNKKQKRRR